MEFEESGGAVVGASDDYDEVAEGNRLAHRQGNPLDPVLSFGH